jgi:hypothetical protein
MTRRTLGLAAWGVALLTTAAGAESPADATLQSKGLTREKGTYVHSSEQAVADKVEEVKGAYGRLNAARYKLAEADQNTMMVAELNQQAAYLQQEKNMIGNQARGIRMPRGMGNTMRGQIQAEQAQEQQAINATKQQIAALKKAAPTPQARKQMEDEIAKRKAEMSEAVTEARKLIDEANATYETLGKDASIKAALAQVKTTTTDAIKLGPSKEFRAAEKTITAAERLLGLNQPDVTSKKGHKARAKK